MNILETLYKDYYQTDRTPQELVSSHWRQMHKQTSVSVVNNALSLKGFGFGDLQQASLPHLILAWVTIAAYLCRLNNRAAIIRLLPKAIALSRRMELPFTYDSFRQVCSLAMIMSFKSYGQGFPLRVVIIGDGYGFLSALIKKELPKARIFLIDLGKTLLFQAHYCSLAYPQGGHFLVTDQGPMDGGQAEDADFIYCPAEHLSKLDGFRFDLAINIASMQEMNQATVSGYFDFLRGHMERGSLFYCCNREEKIMPDSEISRIMDYPWDEGDTFLVDEICPWSKFYFSRHAARRGVKVLNVRVPFVNLFDGPVRHRLCVLKTTDAF